ncbi:PqqD family peptide modification chaperone [Rhodoplanes sp. Z2-YC6860]|uniref:PqqD family peptide modification chaperone n=1 Tax=Rhodoplanes sp. Z2-YC6860 TaxID=674703 RepID=UPI0018DD7A12|nr:PqqD family peptide modification chaperone [Rhodoplanes sp. Z2-YC6860]
MAKSDRITLDTFVGRHDGFVEAEVNQEIVALSIERGTCYGLNRVGSRIWQLLSTPTRVADVCAILVDEYQVDSDTCGSQVLDLLEELRAEGMIKTSEAK